MTPEEHYDEAESALAGANNPNNQPEASAWYQRQAQVHATLALAGFTRDAATAHVHDIPGPVDPYDSREVPIIGTTDEGRPA